MTEKEETEFKVVAPDTITLCVNCGVATGNNPTANNLCQKCLSSTTSAVNANHVFAEKSVRSIQPTKPSPERNSTLAESKGDAAAAVPVKREVNRCTGCRRKVGLTGFRCRCGELFCADHRYSDRHDCCYDYKAAGRETIARENPVVKAAKIVRI